MKKVLKAAGYFFVFLQLSMLYCTPLFIPCINAIKNANATQGIQAPPIITFLFIEQGVLIFATLFFLLRAAWGPDEGSFMDRDMVAERLAEVFRYIIKTMLTPIILPISLVRKALAH